MSLADLEAQLFAAADATIAGAIKVADLEAQLFAAAHAMWWHQQQQQQQQAQ
jgi:hypothetical protein